MSAMNMMDSIIPITRFNKGEAGKIFKEVAAKGTKIVFKNNMPECVLLKPEKYFAMLELLEDYALYLEAGERVKTAADSKLVSHAEVMKQFGITKKDLKDAEGDID